MRLATKAVHSGIEHDPPFRPLSAPIFQTSTFVWDEMDHEADPMYTRYGNPSRRSVEIALAELENAKDALFLSSGMAAIATVCSMLRPGDHVLCQRDVYGGTWKLLSKYIAQMGIDVTFADSSNTEAFSNHLRDNTKLVWIETPTNPTMRIVDIRACAHAAHSVGAVVVADNTFASPVFQNPLDLSCDVVMHSATKYLNGHSDVIGGALMWRDERFTVFLDYLKSAGNNPSPFDCWLMRRGIKTLELRVRKQAENAQAIAEFLATHPRIESVHYPGLESDPGHQLAKSQMNGFGGMLSFVVEDGANAAKNAANKLKLIKIAASLGGVESIIGYPPVMSHAMLSENERRQRGILPGLLRLSVGIENVDDLIEDLDQALS